MNTADRSVQEPSSALKSMTTRCRCSGAHRLRCGTSGDRVFTSASSMIFSASSPTSERRGVETEARGTGASSGAPYPASSSAAAMELRQQQLRGAATGHRRHAQTSARKSRRVSTKLFSVSF